MNSKLNQFLAYIRTVKPNVEVAEQKIREYFSEMTMDSNNINQAYYQYNEDTFYIKDSNGVSIIIGKGLGDIIGTHYSNEGTNITITTSKDDYLIYNSSELDLDNLLEFEKDINVQIDMEVLEEMAAELLNHSNPLIIETFTSDLQNNNKVMQAFLDRAWYLSEALNEQQISDAYISPYDGIDVRQLSVEKNYLELIDKISLNEIKEEAMKYFFSKENSEYFIKEKITDLERKIDFVIKKEEYHKLDNLLNEENELYASLKAEYGIDNDDSLKDKIVNLSGAGDLYYEELQNINQQINELENKVEKIGEQKFSFWQRIKNEPAKQLKVLNEKLLELSVAKEKKGIDLTFITSKHEDLWNKYNRSQDIEHKINSLVKSSNLKNSYTLKEEDEKFYEKRLNLYQKELTKYQDLLKSYENFKEIKENENTVLARETYNFADRDIVVEKYGNDDYAIWDEVNDHYIRGTSKEIIEELENLDEGRMDELEEEYER